MVPDLLYYLLFTILFTSTTYYTATSPSMLPEGAAAPRGVKRTGVGGVAVGRQAGG